MIRSSTSLASALLAGLLAAPAGAQNTGRMLPKPQLEDFAQTPARSWKDFTGRAVLLEFFAYT